MSERFEVQRTIAAPAAEIFAVLVDPQGHVAIDSTGMLMDATGEPVGAEPLSVGQERHARSRAELPLAALKMSKGEAAIPTLMLDADGQVTDNPYARSEA